MSRVHWRVPPPFSRSVTTVGRRRPLLTAFQSLVPSALKVVWGDVVAEVTHMHTHTSLPESNTNPPKMDSMSQLF